MGDKGSQKGGLITVQPLSVAWTRVKKGIAIGHIEPQSNT
jgi:hypothetical protein